MAVEDFLNTYKNAMLNKQIVNPLTSRNTNPMVIPQSEGFGQKVPDWLQGQTSGALNRYMSNKSQWTSDLASKYTDMAAGQVSTDRYGIPTDKTTDPSNYFNQRLQTIGDYGKASLATEEAKARYQSLQNQAELNAGYQVSYNGSATAGASGNNPGAKAVSMAMQYLGTPYGWGGNSPKGFDCSGLMQYVYGKIGINIPRTTYEQAKFGKVVGMGSLLPGDLVLYNTGSRDPNGIGVYSHVAIYIGNGQVIDAPGRGRTVRVTSINNAGNPARAVRPW